MGRRQRYSAASRHAWGLANRALVQAFRSTSPPGTRVELERVKSYGRGLYRASFATHVELSPDRDARSGPYVALVPHEGLAADERARIEVEPAVLERVVEAAPALRVPVPVGIVGSDRGPILVESFVEGIEPDLRAGGRMPIVPWDLVATAAARIHVIDPPAGLAKRSIGEHRATTLQRLEPRVHDQVGAAVCAWMREQLDDPRPGVLLHGDLLGQNLRIHPTEELGVIDWMSAKVGDPGYELAIVTRGLRRPAGGSRGALLDAYNARAAVPTSHDALRFFELALLLGWYTDAEPHGYSREQLRAMLLRRLPG